jgi:hypothetical protein
MTRRSAGYSASGIFRLRFDFFVFSSRDSEDRDVKIDVPNQAPCDVALPKRHRE